MKTLINNNQQMVFSLIFLAIILIGIFSIAYLGYSHRNEPVNNNDLGVISQNGYFKNK